MLEKGVLIAAKKKLKQESVDERCGGTLQPIDSCTCTRFAFHHLSRESAI